MEIEVTINTHIRNDHDSASRSMLKSGTGFMLSLSEAIRELERLGYTENLGPANDHFCCRSGAIKLYPKDIKVDKMIRFDNASDPDDQSILYAISCESKNLKGLYVDSYGLYHDDLSAEIMKCFRDCPC